MKRLFLAMLILTTASPSLFAGLMYVGSLDLSGGVGSMTTLLTFVNHSGVTTETGCAMWDGAAAVAGSASSCGYANDVVMTGAGQIGSPTFAQAGIGSVADLRFVFNPLEPASAPKIVLRDMRLLIYDPSGSQLYDSGQLNAGPMVLDANAQYGPGNAGFVFGLDGTSSAAAAAFYHPDNHIAVSASAIDAEPGADTVLLSTPEPSSIILLGSGGFLICLLRRLRRSR